MYQADGNLIADLLQPKYKGSNCGPKNSLKLGISLAFLDKKEMTCSALAEVLKRYKKAEPTVLKRISNDLSPIRCP